MNYDLSDKSDRRRFVKRANFLLSKQRTNVVLTDESNRTIDQNSYIHVLFRILALDIGVSEDYVKEMHFKREANADIFVTTTKDPITKKTVNFIRSTTELKIPEMSRAINSFLKWAADFGYELPAAKLDDDGNLTFNSEKDKESFHKAQIQTSKLDEFGNSY